MNTSYLMSYAEVMQLYFERSAALQNYWTLYVVIIGGLLAVSSLRQIPNRLTTILVTILFLCFAYKNAGAIVDTIEQRLALLENLKPISAPMNEQHTLAIAKLVLDPKYNDAAGALRFHRVCDGLTVLTLWSMEWRRRRRQAELASVVAK